MAASAALRDALIVAHVLGLRQVHREARQALAPLTLLRNDLVDALREYDIGRSPSIAQRMALLALLLPLLADMIGDAYVRIATFMQDTILALALAQGTRLFQRLRAAMPERPWQATLNTALLTTALRDTPFPSAATGREPSALAADWWQRQGEKVGQRLGDQLTASVEYGESSQQMVERIIGTPEVHGQNGLMAQTQRAAEAVAETEGTMALAVGTEALYQANASLIAGIEHVSVLDNRTSEICQERHGNQYVLGTHEPIPPTAMPYLSGVPYHMWCRSMFVPIFVEEKGLSAPQSPSETFGSFLERQSPASQEVLLGAAARALPRRNFSQAELIRLALQRD